VARSKAKGRPILGGVSGLFFGFFVSLALTVYAGVPLNSVLYIILTIVGVVIGVALGITAPFHRRSKRAAAHRQSKRSATPTTPQPPPTQPAS